MILRCHPECHMGLRATYMNQKPFFVCHPERRVRSPWRPDEESKDPYSAHSLSPRKFFDGARSRGTPMAASNPNFAAASGGHTVIFAAIGVLRLARRGGLAQDDISKTTPLQGIARSNFPGKGPHHLFHV